MVEAQFSQPYTVANAIIRGCSKLEHFTPKYTLDAEVIELAKKVEAVVSDEIEEEITALMEIEMKDGRRFSKLVTGRESPRVSSAEEVKNKFRETVAFAPRSVPEGNSEKIIEIVDRLEEVDDVSELIELLV
jgi:2-methylcitrate dehydratase PrpD